jgi:hypothetical protein
LTWQAYPAVLWPLKVFLRFCLKRSFVVYVTIWDPAQEDSMHDTTGTEIHCNVLRVRSLYKPGCHAQDGILPWQTPTKGFVYRASAEDTRRILSCAIL